MPLPENDRKTGRNDKAESPRPYGARFDTLFPARLAQARAAVGITQTALASYAEVVPRQIAAYERGEARPRQKALQRIALALGTSPGWLLQGTGEAPATAQNTATGLVPQIPVLPCVASVIRDWLAVREIRSPAPTPVAMYPVPVPVGPRAFALSIHEDLDEGLEWAEFFLAFPEAVVVFDPDIPAKSKDFVLIMSADAPALDMSFRKMLVNMGTAAFSTLNRFSAYPHHVLPLAEAREKLVLIPAVHFAAALPALRRTIERALPVG